MGLCVDETTSLQPRPRKAPPLAAPPGHPGRVEHAYPRTGALHLFAGVDTRPGKGYAPTAARKRQVACLAFVAQGEREMASDLTRMYGVLENVRRHKGNHVHAGLATPPRCVLAFPPGHGSWRHQAEQWCASLPRQRLRMADCAEKKPLAHRLMACVAAWNAQAHPLQWSTKSVAQVMAKCEHPMAKAA